MKVGDIVEHVKSGDVALLVQLWEEGKNRGMAEVVIDGHKERWFRSSTRRAREV